MKVSRPLAKSERNNGLECESAVFTIRILWLPELAQHSAAPRGAMKEGSRDGGVEDFHQLRA
jgi:hypothetical protein